MKTAYPQIKGTCSIRLYSNIPFDNTYEHHSLISRKFTYNNSVFYSPNASGDVTYGVPKERFINRLKNATTNYYPHYDITGDFNFDFTNGLVGSVVLELTPAQTNANYLRLTCGDDVYYYFITGINQVNYETYKLSLELDVLMTYQDEFLEGMQGVPVFTQRKHCHRYTDDGIYPHCADLLSNEETFAGVKTNHIKKLKKLQFENALGIAQAYKDITWLYICIDIELPDSDDDSSSIYTMYRSQNTSYPLTMVALPLNAKKFSIYVGNTLLRETSGDDINTLVYKLVNDGAVHGCKLSKYPPYPYGNKLVVIPDANEDLEVKLTLDSHATAISDSVDIGIIDTDNPTIFTFTRIILPASAPITSKLMKAGICIERESQFKHKLTSLKGVDLDILKPSPVAPSITSSRYEDIRLMFSPFTKYSLTATYSSDGVELYPEIFYANVNGISTNELVFTFYTTTTAYIGDNNIFTYPDRLTYTRNGVSFTPYNYYNLQKSGLASCMNYVVPVGENALDVFNATQANSFYTSKLASGITGGLAVAGGIGSIALGVAGAVGTSGMSSVASAGLIAGGVSAIAGGVAGVSTSIKSTNSKIQDLKNTPDSINISGSNYTSDMAISEGDGLPYVIISECSPVVKHNADDFFYNYGYQVARECYFNTALDFTNGLQTIDNNLIGRTIFNYVQLQEDITNKINYDMPLIVKQKLSSIFNNGITLWSFFGNQALWSMLNTPTASNDPDRWFMKCELDNTEYNIMKNNE